MSSSPTNPLSVVVPLYNKRRTIKRAIASVLKQTFCEFELIVVDDGSTDGSAELAAAHNDQRIRIIRQTNAGPGAARNRGANESKAKYLAFLDADDEWAPTFLEASLTGIRSTADCNVTCATRIFSPENEVRLPEANIRTGPWRMPTDLYGYQARNAIHFLHASATVISRATFERYGGFYEEHSSYGEDTYLFAQLALGEEIFRIRKPLVTFHREDSNLGRWRKSLRPIPPIITNPHRLHRHCPPSHATVLSRFLADYASLMARDAAMRGDAKDARQILSRLAGRNGLERQTRRLIQEATVLIRLHPAMKRQQVRDAYGSISRLLPAKDRPICIPRR